MLNVHHDIVETKDADPPSYKLFVYEARAILELCTLIPSLPFLRKLPVGDGHPVLVFPGFGTGDWATLALRWFLRDRGFAVHGWRLGHNTGYDEKLDVLILKRFNEIFDRYHRRVSLIGWSLGGVYARELARFQPEKVRCVITMGSPFADLKSTNIWRLYEFVSGHKLDEIDTDMLKRLKEPPPVPTTSIFSRTDGVVSYKSSQENKSSMTENIEVPGSHCGLVHNPLVFWLVADRLSQPVGKWRPFDYESTPVRKLFYHLATNADESSAKKLSLPQNENILGIGQTVFHK